MSYPRQCRGNFGPHLIAGPEDEVHESGKRPVCVLCRRAGRPARCSRYYRSPAGQAGSKRRGDEYTRSGASAKASLKYARRIADDRDQQLLEDLRGPHGPR